MNSVEAKSRRPTGAASSAACGARRVNSAASAASASTTIAATTKNAGGGGRRECFISSTSKIKSKTKKRKPKSQKPQHPIDSNVVVIVIEADQNNVTLACSFSLEKSLKIIIREYVHDQKKSQAKMRSPHLKVAKTYFRTRLKLIQNASENQVQSHF